MLSLESQIKTAADNAQNRFGKDIITDRYEFRGDITLTVARQAVADVVRWLRDSAGFDMLVNLSSVDNMGESPRFEVNYTLTQSETGANLSLKTKLDDGEEVPSVTEIFQSANWHEREAWDLMGIRFSGHPDLRRILMWEGYPYFPLRKDFPVQGVPTELPGVAFTEAAPTQGAPFATEQGRCPSACREPRSHKFLAHFPAPQGGVPPMTRLPFILPICIISLLSGCQDANPAEREWKDQLYKNLAIVGARNWIVIAESSFPAYTGTGIRTMVSDKTSDEVFLDVLNMLEEEAHVVPRIMISSELRSVTEDYAPGIKRYRNNINKMLPGRQHFELMSRTINSLIEDAARQFNVLVIKTKTSLPYSNIYIELDSGYWNSESETALRKSLEARDAANRRAAQDRVLDVPLVPGAAPAPQGVKENPPLPGTPASPTDNLPELPRENRQPASPSGDRAPGVPPPPIRDPLGGKTAIARFS